MARVEYRYQRIEGVGNEVVTALNRLGEAGWHVVQLEPTTDGYGAWLSREVPIMSSGFRPERDGDPVTRTPPANAPTRR